MLLIDRKAGEFCEGDDTAAAAGVLGVFGDRKTDLSVFAASLECDSVISAFFTDIVLGGNGEFD